MDHSQQLAALQHMAHVLVAPQSAARRLGTMLRYLRQTIPFGAARVVVLPPAAGHASERTEPWSLQIPRRGEGNADTCWPRELTAELLQRRRRVQRLTPHGEYLGWPIRWQQHMHGAIEFMLTEQTQCEQIVPLLEAMTPLLASALHENSSDKNDSAHIVLPAEAQRSLDMIAAQLQAPLLLQPLLGQLLQTALAHTGAERGSIHLAEANGRGLHLLSFELPHHAGSSTALAQSNRAHELAKITLANARPMIRQVQGETHFAAPIVFDDRLLGVLAIEGSALDQQTLTWTQQLATLAAPAVLRAQFYQQLTDARVHLQQVFDELPTGLALTDGTGTLLRANPSWWRLWGIGAADIEAINLIPWDILPRILHRLPDPLAFSEQFTSAITEAKTATITLQQPTQELRLLFMPVRDTLSLQSGFLLAVDDITREREADRIKSEFVSVVSHELRTPLTSILGYTELLLARDFEPNERKEFIQTVYKQADHLSSLVEDLLNVSRIEAGKIKLERWVMALPKLVRDLVAQLITEIDVERHRMLLDVPDTLPPIYADRDKVRQILSNLLSNAIKYSPEGGEVVLQAGVLRHPIPATSNGAKPLPAPAFGAHIVDLPPSAPPLPPDPAILISVRDRGIGIPPDDVPRVFDRFFRVDNSNTRRIGGTGLGLAITKALVELHGGRIWVESTPGEGSTFYVTLPLATEMLHTRQGRALQDESDGSRRNFTLS